ncbi:MAG: glycosyltransferase [Pseudomonadota bacterium]
MTSFRYTVALYAYNQADCIKEAALAVLAQACPPIEILFTDDCSQDATFDVLQEVAAQYDGPHRVVLNRNPQNLGVIEHIHKVFSLTESEVIINCAGDDLSFPHRASRTIDAFERDKPLLACSQAKVEYEDGTSAPKSYSKASFYHRRDALSASDSMQLYLGATASWHRELFEKYGPIQFKDCFEDLVFGFRAALEDRVSLIDEELMIYRVGGGVTNSVLAPETRSDVQKRRVKELRREISVLSQRQIDARTYGLHPEHPVMRRIANALRARRLRLGYITDGVTSLLGPGLRHPVQTLGAAFSETRRWRKALNRKS